MHISSQLANLHSTADRHSENTSQALFGERFKVLEQTELWTKIKLENDSYTGFVLNECISDSNFTSTHRIVTRSSPLFTAPDIKSPVQEILLFGSELELNESTQPNFFQTPDGFYVWKSHARPLNDFIEGDLVETAENLFLGAPYLWGGRSPMGLDCSAVVQLSALLHGRRFPRDTKDQEPFLRDNLEKNNLASKIDPQNLDRNDLVYWPGHVAIMRDENLLTHATAHSLSCCIESLYAVNTRAGEPTSCWRLHPSFAGS